MEKTGLGSFLQKARVCMHACMCMCVCSLSHVFVTPAGSSAHRIFQARTLERLLFPTTGELPDPGIAPASLRSPAPVGGFFTTVHLGSPKSSQ